MKKIKTKILKKTLIITIASLIMCTFVSALVIGRIVTIARTSTESTRDISVRSSSDSLIDQALTQAIEYTDFCSQALKQKIESIILTISVAEKNIENIYVNPSEYMEKPYNHVSQCPEDVNCMQWILPEGMEMSGDIERETYLLGNIENHFKSINELNPYILSIYFTSESGINIGYDNTAKRKPMNFDGRTAIWYKTAKETKQPYISDPYNDSFSRGFMVTMAVPCIGDDGEFYGVLAMDFLITELNEIVSDVKVGKDGYAMILSPNMVISAEGLTEENQYNFKEFLGETGSKTLENMTDVDESGVVETILNSKQMYMVYSKIGISDWITVFMMPKGSIVESSEYLSERIINIFNESESQLYTQIIFIVIIWSVLLVGLIFVVVYFVGKLADEISNPITILCSAIEKIGEGNLEYKSCIKTEDEIQELSMAFERMTSALKQYIDNYAKVTAEKQRISTELAVATQIQASVLPCVFPAFPLRDDFDIYAKMSPAKEVGGDFYDFYLIGENKFGIVMADVSGKGVPAALFMMISKTLIKNLAYEGLEVDEIFKSANRGLYEGNETLMFVTAFMAIVDLNTGVMDYVNAGHNTPLLRKKNGEFKWMEPDKNCILAVMPEVNFKKQTIQLEKGDIFYTYTDGVTEAVNRKNEFYGDYKLITEINSIENIDDRPVSDTIDYIRKTIDDFSDGAEQADDITMLIFKYLGKN